MGISTYFVVMSGKTLRDCYLDELLVNAHLAYDSEGGTASSGRLPRSIHLI
jgi:hypothetical protein